MKKDKDLIVLEKLTKKDLIKIIRDYRFAFSRYERLMLRSVRCLKKFDGFEFLALVNDLEQELLHDLIIRK